MSDLIIKPSGTNANFKVQNPSGTDKIVMNSSGTITTGTLGSGVVFPAGGTGNAISVAVIADQQPNGTDGGTANNGDWRTRVLNTEISDPDGIVSISSNQFTLGSGTYLISWSAPAYNCARHQSKLYDITGSADLVAGSSAYTASSDYVVTRSMGSYVHAITANNTYEIRHRVETSRADNGFGVTSSFGIVNIYTIVNITKLK